jgi:Putative DNA-binding domain
MAIQSWKPITTRADLPTAGTEESEYLDLKEQPWPDTDDGKREIARDVAQFANHLGGSIIVGAVEDGKDRLTGYVTVAEAAKVAQRVNDVCHGALSPRAELRITTILIAHAKEIVVINVMPHVGIVAIKVKGSDRWEFYRRYGKGKRPVSFEEVEHMWTEGRRGQVILSKVPVDPTQDQTRLVIVDAVASDPAFLREPVRLMLHDSCFELELKNGKHFFLPYEFVRAAWPDLNGQWTVSLTAKFEWEPHGQVMKAGYSP